MLDTQVSYEEGYRELPALSPLADFFPAGSGRSANFCRRWRWAGGDREAGRPDVVGGSVPNQDAARQRKGSTLAQASLSAIPLLSR